MDSAVVEQLRSAARAYQNGDTGPLVALLHDDLHWRGRERGALWWKHAPE